MGDVRIHQLFFVRSCGARKNLYYLTFLIIMSDTNLCSTILAIATYSLELFYGNVEIVTSGVECGVVLGGHRGEARLNISWYNLQFGNHSQSYHPNHPTGARGGGQNGGDITAVNFSPHTLSLCTSLHRNSCVDNIDNVDNSWVDNNLVKLTRRPPQFQRIINLKS